MTQLIVSKNDKGEIINRADVKKFFDAMGKKTLLKATDYSTRSLPQNDLFHSWLPILLHAMREIGMDEIRTVDDAKRYVKGLFLTTYLEDKATGTMVPMVKKTSKLTKSEMTIFLNDVAKWSAEWLNTVLPFPGDNLNLFLTQAA